MTKETVVENGTKTVDGNLYFFLVYVSMLNFIIETVEFIKLVKELKAKVVDMKNQLKPLKEK